MHNSLQTFIYGGVTQAGHGGLLANSAEGSQSDPSAEKARFIAPAARNREGKTVVKGFYTVSTI